MITALRISQGSVHLRSAGQRDPINTHTWWDVDYTVLYPRLGESVDYTTTLTTREGALKRAVEILQDDLEHA